MIFKDPVEIDSTPQRVLGIQTSQVGEKLYMSVAAYISHIQKVTIPDKKDRTDDAPLKTDEHRAFRSIVGALSFVSKFAPCLLYDIQSLATALATPKLADLKKANTLVDRAVTDCPPICFRPLTGTLEIWIYTDASHARICNQGADIKGASVFLVEKNAYTQNSEQSLHRCSPIYFCSKRTSKPSKGSSFSAELVVIYEVVIDIVESLFLTYHWLTGEKIQLRLLTDSETGLKSIHSVSSSPENWTVGFIRSLKTAFDSECSRLNHSPHRNSAEDFAKSIKKTEVKAHQIAAQSQYLEEYLSLEYACGKLNYGDCMTKPSDVKILREALTSGFVRRSHADMQRTTTIRKWEYDRVDN